MKLDYCRFSPFQFSTAEQTVMPHKEVVAEKRELKHLHEVLKRKTHDLGSTMPAAEARLIPSHPTEYISPNSPDAMRQIKSVFKW